MIIRNKRRNDRHSQKKKQRKIRNRNLKLFVERHTSRQATERRRERLIRGAEEYYKSIPPLKKLWLKIKSMVK